MSGRKITLKTRRELKQMRRAGRIIAEALDLAEKTIAPGITTGELNRRIEDLLSMRGARFAFKVMNGFPAACCISLNEEIVHGIPGPRKLAEGDIVSIDIGTIFRFTETVVWKALENSGVNYVDWTARREIHKGSPVLKVYLEPKGEDTPTEIYIEETLYEHVKKIDDGFIRDKENLDSIEQLMGTLPIKVQLLAKGTFSHYAKIKEEQGADLAQLKPPHINPSEDVLSLLLTGAPTRTEEDVQIL